MQIHGSFSTQEKDMSDIYQQKQSGINLKSSIGL